MEGGRKGWKCGWGRRWMWGGWRGVGRGGNVDGVDVGCGVGGGGGRKGWMRKG